MLNEKDTDDFDDRLDYMKLLAKGSNKFWSNIMRQYKEGCVEVFMRFYLPEKALHQAQDKWIKKYAKKHSKNYISVAPPCKDLKLDVIASEDVKFLPIDAKGCESGKCDGCH